MKLDPKIVEAAGVMSKISDSSDLRARRVLRTASESVPWQVSLKVAETLSEAIGYPIDMTVAREACSAGLATWAEEGE
jgi:hypothetical protein